MESKMSIIETSHLSDTFSVISKDSTLLELHDVLDKAALEMLNEMFKLEKPRGVDKNKLKNMLESVSAIKYDDNNFSTLFLKINAKRDGFVNWDELISHILLGFQSKDSSEKTQSLELPITGLPKIIKSYHRYFVSRMTFCPAVMPDRSTNFVHGNYVTVSRDGVINYWSLDMQLERSAQSTCPELKVQPTWVTDLVCLPDVNIVCTSSTERDLRFYDTTAKKFELRVMISSLDHAVLALHYHFSQDIEEESKLVCGDQNGSVRIIFFSSKERGPFKSTPGIPLNHVRYEQFVKGAIKSMRIIEFRKVHTDWVRQVSYYPSLHFFMSASCCQKQSMFLSDFNQKTSYSFKVPKGIYCFDFSDRGHVIATGGPDCLIRIWNPFVPTRPSSVLTGHHAAIVALVLQDDGHQLFSLSKDKCIKIWNVMSQVCIQTYLQLPADLGERTPFTVFYNPHSRQIFIGSMTIVAIVCSPLLNPEETDGYTHTHVVSKVLYNRLFKCVITCGMDSAIIVWSPWNGKKLMVVKDAHIKIINGSAQPIEITAATFDPGYQRLLTGARDGSIKIWNFNTGTCLRNMSIEQECEITSLVWLHDRILAVGWNRHVTEFADGNTSGCKEWDTRHTEDVLCAASRVPQTLATSTYNGELMLWRLETGQPYRRFHVGNPCERLKLNFPKAESTKIRSSPRGPLKSSKTIQYGSKRDFQSRETIQLKNDGKESQHLESESTKTKTISRTCRTTGSAVPVRQLAVHAMIFLSSRPMEKNIGTLLVSVANGTIQLWSHHPAGGFLGTFCATHIQGDYVFSLNTDINNEYLFTGHTTGYIKIWLMKNYGWPQPVQISLPLYRKIFPFLWNDRIICRAKRAVIGQNLPILLSSYKAHLQTVTGLEYIETSQILLSCSSDRSVRLWTLGGRYIATLGTFKPWVPLYSEIPVPSDFMHYIPPELKRAASFTTRKIFNGGMTGIPLTRRKMIIDTHVITAEELEKGVYGKKLDEPYLGHHFALPRRSTNRFTAELDRSMPYIPVYCHLILQAPIEIQRPPTPKNIKDARLSGKEKMKPSQSFTTEKKTSKSQSQVTKL